MAADKNLKIDVVDTVVAESTDTDVATLTNMTNSYTCITTQFEEPEAPPVKAVKIRKHQLHTKSYSPKWERDPNYQGWVSRSKKGDGYYYCLACNQDYTCGKSELDKHASSKKHCMNVMSMTKANNEYSIAYSNDISSYDMQTCEYETDAATVVNTDFDASSTSITLKGRVESKEESFGKYIVSELKRIKKKKTYELVKWEILQALQKAMLEEAETEDSEDS